MRHSTYFLLTVTLTAAAIAALIIAVVFDGLDDSKRSIIFGCIACACSIPAFTSATILFKSGNERNDAPAENTVEDGDGIKMINIANLPVELISDENYTTENIPSETTHESNPLNEVDNNEQ